MIWLTWRQFRLQAAVVFGALAVLAVVLIVSGPNLVHLSPAAAAACRTDGGCSVQLSTFRHTMHMWLDILVIVVPGLVGTFWGAPLIARELETGTYRLAWTQSVSRARWLWVKLGLVGLASVAAAGALSLMVTWWSSSLDRSNMNPFGTFEQRDIVPLAYAAFAFALGVTAGAFIRRVVPAMAATLVGFVAVRVVFSNWVRLHLLAPNHQAFALNGPNLGFGSTNGGPFTLLANPPNIQGAWIYSTSIVDRSGTAITPQFVASACPKLANSLPPGAGPQGAKGVAARVQAPAGAKEVFQACVAKIGTTYHEVVAYQPSSHYWPFQWFETGIFVALAAILIGVSAWWVRRRLS
jgi:hypothetical protein